MASFQGDTMRKEQNTSLSNKFLILKILLKVHRRITLGTCGLNSTALWIASTAFISVAVRPLLDAVSGLNLHVNCKFYKLKKK